MSTGMKLFLAFVGGAAVGAGAVALLNRGKLDLDYLKPLANDLLSKGLELKDAALAKMEDWQAEMEKQAAPQEAEPETRAKAA